ncbi:MAG: hypothetical protein V1918_09195 [Planctomycetota bacterium]
MKRCASCGAEWTEKHTPGRRDLCAGCGAALCACRNCRFFSPDAAGSRAWCREPMARDERPRTPEEANTCGYFLFADAKGRAGARDRSSRARAELERLFKPPDA